MQVVDDRDYFAVLGVPREATGYEVRRAFLELRRAFEPSRVITPDIADLAEDVRKIAVVLEEAHDILKDAARRDRYRRAIEAVPGQ
jgi:curved DNA-binding protein CbpA